MARRQVYELKVANPAELPYRIQILFDPTLQNLA